MNATYTVKLNPYDKNKLSALITIDSTEAVRFDYTVQGKTANASFHYDTGQYSVNPEITVVGLYANYLNTVTLNLYTEKNAVETFLISISTQGQDYGDVPWH